MAVNIHITIIELNALHTKRQNLFQELDAVIHLLMDAKHWGLRKSRNATSLNSRFKSLDTRSEERRVGKESRYIVLPDLDNNVMTDTVNNMNMAKTSQIVEYVSDVTQS